MTSTRARCAESWGLACALLAGACAGSNLGLTANEPAQRTTSAVVQPPLKPRTRPRPPAAPVSEQASGEADAEYYRSWTAAPGARTPRELDGLDFRRLRRGRLYLQGGIDTHRLTALNRVLSDASAKNDDATVLHVTAQLLADDQTDIRANLLRAAALRRQGEIEQAELHEQLGAALVESIVRDGDGRSFERAWTAFQVKEEYAMLSARGYAVSSQARVENDRHRYDVLEAHSLKNPDPSGEPERFYFDVTELFAEEKRQQAR